MRDESYAGLVDAWRDGDREAGRRLFERHYAGVARFFRNKVGEAGLDLIQRTFLTRVRMASPCGSTVTDLPLKRTRPRAVRAVVFADGEQLVALHRRLEQVAASLDPTVGSSTMRHASARTGVLRGRSTWSTVAWTIA